MDIQAASNNINALFQQPGLTYVEEPYIITKTLPFLGRIRCVNDSNGMMQLGGIVLYWIYGTLTMFFIMLLPHYQDGRISLVVVLAFLWVSAMCLLALLRAATTNPGQIPSREMLTSFAESQLTFCPKCQRTRPKRAHHCRRCGQCVMKMDHHCPWINNCVGEGNHYLFLQLLFYAMLLGLFAFVLCMLHFWVFPKCTSCDPNAFHIKYSIWFMYLEVVLSANMAIIMGLQLTAQHLNVLADRTTLENMMPSSDEESVVLRSWRAAYTELCGSPWVCCWFLPLYRRRPVPAPYQAV